VYFSRLSEIYLSNASHSRLSLVSPVIFALLATIIVLENLGIRLSAVTTLGVVSVAIALALTGKPSAIFLRAAPVGIRPIRPGSTSSWTPRHEGFVVRVGTRATALRVVAQSQ